MIHFVCLGNLYRSRMAEAILKSLHLSQYSVMSSGVIADQTAAALLISQCAHDVLEDEQLLSYTKRKKSQLTQARLDRADITIFMNREVYSECLRRGLKPPNRSYIWDINDIKRTNYTPAQYRDEILPEAKRTFSYIKRHILDLVAFLKRPKHRERIDVLDATGRPTGLTSDITSIQTEGLIFPGVHLALYTPSGKVILEQRSSTIVFNPGLWDLTMGGIVAAGESPDETVVRELKEELGIHVKKPRKLFVWEYHHYLPHYGFHNHCFVHTYLAKVPDDVDFKLQTKEVADAGIFALKDVKKLNQRHRHHDEKIIPMHHYYDRLLAAIEAELQI